MVDVVEQFYSRSLLLCLGLARLFLKSRSARLQLLDDPPKIPVPAMSVASCMKSGVNLLEMGGNDSDDAVALEATSENELRW